MKHKIDKSTIRDLLRQYGKGPCLAVSKGFQICCPWHDDRNPSCMVFHSGVFYCMVCHGSRGEKGVSPHKGFIALGMPQERAKRIFISGTEPNIKTSIYPSLEDLKIKPKPNPEAAIKSRDSWPKDWGFRHVHYATIIAPWFQRRFHPTRVTLMGDRLSRIAFVVGGIKDTDDPKYVKHEVYLRLSTFQEPKVINSKALTFDPNVKDYLPATLFGLIDNRIRRNSRGIFITEGPYDTIHLLQLLMSAGESYDVIGLLGIPHWANVLKQLEQVIIPKAIEMEIPFILAFDNDDAGRKITKTACADLRRLLPERLIKRFEYPAAIKDVGDLSFNDFEMAFKSLRQQKGEKIPA